jgi:hypothetical protein
MAPAAPPGHYSRRPTPQDHGDFGAGGCLLLWPWGGARSAHRPARPASTHEWLAHSHGRCPGRLCSRFNSRSSPATAPVEQCTLSSTTRLATPRRRLRLAPAITPQILPRLARPNLLLLILPALRTWGALLGGVCTASATARCPNAVQPPAWR